MLREVRPTVGPVAGKTRITLEGEHFIPGVLLRLGPDNLCSYVSRYDWFSTGCNVIHPSNLLNPELTTLKVKLLGIPALVGAGRLYNECCKTEKRTL